MKLVPAGLHGSYVVESAPNTDERGSFSRVWDANEATARGLLANFVQVSMSTSRRAGTLRGLHMQAAPYSEVKLLCCAHGSIFDVAVDARPESPSFQRVQTVTLDAREGHQLYLPAGCLHGFQSLEDDCVVLYMISQEYRPDAAVGVLWRDPELGIQWPMSPTVISSRDLEFPSFSDLMRSTSTSSQP